MLLVDVSGSEMFGTKTQLKKEIITEISATLAFSALQNNDKVGLLLFSNQVELYIPPKKGKSHILRIIRELLEFKPKNKLTDINISLEFLSGILKKKSIVFVLSDFMDDKYEKTLSIMAKKHDLTGIRVFDPKDELIPNLGLIQINDSETGEIKWINTQSSSVRKAYSNHYQKNVSFFESVFKKNGAGILSCRVDESYVKKLLNFFNSRS